jgi:dynein heavy chain, axonemal
MVATFKLCSEQLSSQDHYDYGMRAVKSTITACGNLKGEFPEEAEDVLVLRGLRDINIPKFLAPDLPLFHGIIADLFTGIEPPEVDYSDLHGALKHACGELQLQPTPTFAEKVIQLYETTIVRHGLMLVGPTMAGKTSSYRALAGAMTELQHLKRFERVRTVVLNPKSITMGQLYGDFDDNTHEWTDGVLACYMRECSEDTSPDKKWIMFDGPGSQQMQLIVCAELHCLNLMEQSMKPAFSGTIVCS